MADPTALALLDYFSEVPDPRVDRTKHHPLINVITIAVCAVLSGADGWTEVEAFGYAKKAWLEGFLDMESGIPSHDTFGRVFGQIDPGAFQEAFMRWTSAISGVIEGVIAIDGKTLRHSYDRGESKGAIVMVSAWAEQNHLVLGQRKVSAKSNEITALPELLKMLALNGCIVTIDAMGAQKTIAAQIVEQEGDYVLALKGNQGRLHEETAWFFMQLEQGALEVEPEPWETVDFGHGREERRMCLSVDPYQFSQWFSSLEAWKGLKSVSLVRSERRIGEKRTSETRYYISSLPPDAEHILMSARSHWGIENKLHWVLDIAFREDDSRIRQGNAAENMAVLRHIAVNMLKQDHSVKGGIKNKRLRCAWDDLYREKILYARLN